MVEKHSSHAQAALYKVMLLLYTAFGLHESKGILQVVFIFHRWVEHKTPKAKTVLIPPCWVCCLFKLTYPLLPESICLIRICRTAVVSLQWCACLHVPGIDSRMNGQSMGCCCPPLLQRFQYLPEASRFEFFGVQIQQI